MEIIVAFIVPMVMVAILAIGYFKKLIK